MKQRNEVSKSITIFSFIVSIVFVFLIGILYATLRPDNLFLKATFIIIGILLLAYIVHILWDFLPEEKKR